MMRKALLAYAAAARIGRMRDQTKYAIHFYRQGVTFEIHGRGRRHYWQDIAFIHDLLEYPPPPDMRAPVPEHRFGPMYELTREQLAFFGKFRRNRSRVERGFPPKE